VFRWTRLTLKRPGGVLENHEITGLAYNNIAQTTSVTGVMGENLASPVTEDGPSGLSDHLPPTDRSLAPHLAKVQLPQHRFGRCTDQDKRKSGIRDPHHMVAVHPADGCMGSLASSSCAASPAAPPHAGGSS
jgi:hypothetical protein